MDRRKKVGILAAMFVVVCLLLLFVVRSTSIQTNPPLGKVVKLTKIHRVDMDMPNGRVVQAREFMFYDREKYPSLLVPLKDERGNDLTMDLVDDPKLPPGSFRLVQRFVQPRTIEGVNYPGYYYIVAEYHLSQPLEPQIYIPRVKPRK